MSSFIIVKLEILRKMKKIYVLFMSSLLLLSCAKDDVSKPSEWPEWPTPSKPKIENAVLRGVNGETVVAAGDKVKFTAQISDEYNDLVSFQLLVTMDGAEILNLSKGLSGRSAVIEEEATLPFVAGFQNGRPVVTIKAVNDLGGNESTLTLDEAASVAVTRPETPSQLYLVDDLGNVYEMDKESQNETDYSFRTSAADLAGIGDHFKVAEKVINNKQGKIENKITSTDKLMNLVYGEINFTNKIYTSASESEQKKVTEIYIMIPEDIVNLDSYAQYQKYIEEFSKKVFERNKNTKIGIIGIKGPISSMEIVDGKGIIKDDDEGDVPGISKNAEIVAKLTNSSSEVIAQLAKMNTEKKFYYNNLEAAIALARESYSTDSNKILISLFDDVPAICNGEPNRIHVTTNEALEEGVKKHNQKIVDNTKLEIDKLKKDDIAFILLRPDDASYNKKWYNADTGELQLDFDGSDYVKQLYGTMDKPYYGKIYSLDIDNLENIVTKYIYNDVMDRIGTTLKNIEFQVIFSNEISENFDITILNKSDSRIDISKLDSDGKVVCKIGSINENDTETLVKYKLSLKDNPASIINKQIGINIVLMAYGDKTSSSNLVDSPKIKVTQSSGNTNNTNNANNDTQKPSDSNISNGDNKNNYTSDPTIAKENFPKAGKIVLTFVLVSLIGCAGVGITKMINLRDVK